jgi:hypothetical protein
MSTCRPNPPLRVKWGAAYLNWAETVQGSVTTMSSTRRDDKKPKPTNERVQRKKRWEGSHKEPAATINTLPELMRINDCARDASVCTKTIRRWIDADLLSVWKPHPRSRTMRIKRFAWEAFKQRQRR